MRHRDDRVGEAADGDGERALRVGLEQGAAGDQGAVDRGAVLGEEVQADRVREVREHLGDVPLGPADGGSHPVDDDPRVLHGAPLAEVDQGPDQPRQADRVGGADDEHLVGDLEGGQGELVAARAAAEVVVVEAEPRVDHHVAVPARDLGEELDGAGADLGPAVGTRQPGHHGELRVEGPLDAGEPLLQPPAGGQPGRRQQSGDLVQHAQRLGDRAAVGVGVDKGGPGPAAEVGGQRRRDRGPAGCAGGSPHGDHPPLAR